MKCNNYNFLLLLFVFICISCSNSTKTILKSTNNGEKGWEYVLENCKQSKEFKLIECRHVSYNQLTMDDSPFKGYEGISMNDYKIRYNEKEFEILVFFKYDEPRYICDRSELNDKHFGLLLLAFWDDRSGLDKIDDAISKRAWDWVRLQQYLHELRNSLHF